MILGGFACTKPGCLQPGQTAFKCGVCEKPATTPIDTHLIDQFKEDRRAAKASFVALHPSLTNDRDRWAAFIQAEPQWLHFNSATAPAALSSVPVSSKTTGLQAFFANEEKIDLPFYLG